MRHDVVSGLAERQVTDPAAQGATGTPGGLNNTVSTIPVPATDTNGTVDGNSTASGLDNSVVPSNASATGNETDDEGVAGAPSVATMNLPDTMALGNGSGKSSLHACKNLDLKPF